VGAKADFTLIDLARLRVGPVFDPIRMLLHATTSDCVEMVVVDGDTVVENGRVLAFDVADDVGRVRDGAHRIQEDFASRNWSGRKIEDVFPPALPAWTA
jgi:cytosine/adenosine deaminase-related metal-dependent hydrolase